MSQNFLVYDAEIVRCIPQKDEEMCSEFEYCRSWVDFAGMKISTICCYDFLEDSFHVFCEDNFAMFQILVHQREHVIGFNSISFDDKLLSAHGIQIATTYDLQLEIMRASKNKSRKGFSLGKTAEANNLPVKSGSGANAPKLWQRGKIGYVLDYCLNDCALTKKILMRGLMGSLVCPVSGYKLQLPMLGENDPYEK
jgi:hypothetical protein